MRNSYGEANLFGQSLSFPLDVPTTSPSPNHTAIPVASNPNLINSYNQISPFLLR
ncbi:hypothetical protein LguiA_026685 [Lonicera macranthoides]